MISERQHIEAPPEVDCVPLPPSYEEANGVYASHSSYTSTEKASYFLAEVSIDCSQLFVCLPCSWRSSHSCKGLLPSFNWHEVLVLAGCASIWSWIWSRAKFIGWWLCCYPKGMSIALCNESLNIWGFQCFRKVWFSVLKLSNLCLFTEPKIFWEDLGCICHDI